MDTAWTQILSGTLSSEEEDAMRSLFNDTDCLEKRQFSPLHDVVLGLKKGDMEAEVLTSSSFINSVDSNGRTPLSWAASRGDVRIVQSLIRLGANPNIVSVCDMSPLHFAMRATTPRCIVPLLAAGGKVDRLSDWLQTP
jgi:ankyrin repeat protein